MALPTPRAIATIEPVQSNTYGKQKRLDDRDFAQTEFLFCSPRCNSGSNPNSYQCLL
ncbi:hypothetical protein [uncultured Nostoc sp.]|uniref:hypothetical protein n=1 Tax=uncultured Nostoc sp. TaxID=340711 RepID=UPI0035CA8A40